ncbi:MAG: FtsQ-type POTRA domain-containing protein [Firmicutes bacterium]|nr:FtsQ-type POTRA domain-containing protein [Bacillota bacterium]
MDKFQGRRPFAKRKERFSGSTGHLRKIKRSLLGVLLLFLLVWTSVTFINSDLFCLELINIMGNSHTPATEVRYALQIEEGENIWKISTELLEERVLSIPRVETVEITRDLPSTLNVIITERPVLALVPYQEYLLEVGTNGQILGTTQDTQLYDVPLITGVVPVAGTVGQVLLSAESLQRVEEVGQAMRAVGVVISEINLAQEENVVVITMEGVVVWLGTKDFAEKADILVQIVGKLSGRQGEGYLDLRVASAPAFHILKTAEF